MKVAVMQPYFFPYIGYFQLIDSVDIFVVYDDVQYIDRGWVNRNRISVEGRVKWLTFPVRKASRELAINQRYYLAEDNAGVIRGKLRAAYSGSRYFEEAFPLLSDLIGYGDSNVASFNTNLLKALALHLGISSRFQTASELDIPKDARGEDRVLEICRMMGADRYINPIGGVELYHRRKFDKAGIELSFIKPLCEKDEVGGEVLYLSIIHELMERGGRHASARLKMYEFYEPGASA